MSPVRLDSSQRGAPAASTLTSDDRDLGPLLPQLRPSFRWPNLRTSVTLLLSDGAALSLTTAIVAGMMDAIGHDLRPLGRIYQSSLIMVPLGFLLSNLYPACGLTPAAEFRQVVRAGGLMLGAFVTAWMVSHGFMEGMTAMIFMVIALPTLVACRSATRRGCACYDWWAQPVLILGPDSATKPVHREMQRHRWSGLRPVTPTYDLDEMPNHFSESLTREEMVTCLARRHHADHAFVLGDTHDLAAFCRPGIDIPFIHLLMADGAELPTLWSQAGECAGRLELRVRDRLLSPGCRAFKRVTDVLITLALIPLLLPLLLLLAVLIKTTSAGPAFYRQKRIGHGGRCFDAWKLRTMVPNADEQLRTWLEEKPNLRAEWERAHKLKKDPRITRVGNVLRKTSLDELPQFWNVLIGEMSLVGPRPIPIEERDAYLDFECYVRVRPGITGLWQISGRNNTTYDERIAFDDYYVRNWSPWLDLYILLRTIKTVLLREGAY